MKKKAAVIICLAGMVLLASFKMGAGSGDPVFISGSEQRAGDAVKGYEYLTTGDFLKSGMPYEFFVFAVGEKSENLLNRTGKNAKVEHGYNVITNKDSIDIVIPTCLQCHSEKLEGKLIIGLGNSSADFTVARQQNSKLKALSMWQITAPKKYKAAAPLIRSLVAINASIETEVQGVNPADKLAAALVAHRDPQTLVWSDKPLLKLPGQTIPTDVPAWWLLKKKNAMFYTGFGRGDFSKFLMMSNLLTVKDTGEAVEVSSHFGDVLAYIRSLQPPPYPKPINNGLALRGKEVFAANCQQCHGTYGEGGQYPNLLVPGSTIRTDSMLYLANQQGKQFIDWFNKSWFAQGANPARLEPSNGYVAPPLDGVWATAPYLHNGSVPTIEALLNSKLRPRYWTRDFSNTSYNYQRLGHNYEAKEKPDGKKYYNTDLPGYGNYGHYFGDALTDDERKAVIEYLKTL